MTSPRPGDGVEPGEVGGIGRPREHAVDLDIPSVGVVSARIRARHEHTVELSDTHTSAGHRGDIEAQEAVPKRADVARRDNSNVAAFGHLRAEHAGRDDPDRGAFDGSRADEVVAGSRGPAPEIGPGARGIGRLGAAEQGRESDGGGDGDGVSHAASLPGARGPATCTLGQRS